MNLRECDFKRILKIGIELSTEKNHGKLLESIVENGMEITNCNASILYLLEKDKLSFRMMKMLPKTESRKNNEFEGNLPPIPIALSEKNICAYAAVRRSIVNIADVNLDERFDFSTPESFDRITGYHTKSLLVVPIENNENELIGVLQMMNAQDDAGNIIPFSKAYELIIRSLSSMAAIELSNLRYVEELKKQLQSFVEALATAIDERTPYNGTHTRKVAECTGLLVDYINKKHIQNECPEYFDEEHREKLMLAALLHDIGKMIVPLHVMNRATRLDRDIIRLQDRFELLKSYYEVDMLRHRITVGEYEEIIVELNAAMEFIMEIDTMGYLDDDNYEKVRMLARKYHVKEDGTITPYLTEYEAECLSIRRGTLTEEARRQMEAHVVMTEKILGKVHFNRNYEMVPVWAVSHHEFIDGSGYPNHLSGDELPIETRILTVSDIYDALTATDRPYKKPMPKEQAIDILKEMAEEGKIELRLVMWLAEALREDQAETLSVQYIK